MKRTVRMTAAAVLTVLTLVSVLACSSIPLIKKPVNRAVAVLRPLQGSAVQGTIFFIQEGKDIRIVADITGLSPGKHGIHIHEFGDATTTDGSSLGGHFNPKNIMHGGPDDKVRHLGDLGNIEADRTGRAKFSRIDSQISLSGGNSIIGRSIVIKEKADDLKTQPGGAAGSRIGFGVIGISATEGD